MVTIRINKSDGVACVSMKTTICPKCGAILTAWDWPIEVCRRCGFLLINTNDLIDYKFSRVRYHKEGPY